MMPGIAAPPARADRSAASTGVYAYDLQSRPWVELPRGGAREKAVRRDDAAGLFLGLVVFDPMTRSGLHQHLGTATSYFLSGSLTDFQGTAGAGTLGINLPGATHDAVSYGGCTLVSRLEGPVVIPQDELAIHPHASRGPLVTPNPESPPDIAVVVAQTMPVATRFGGVARRALFDYAGTGTERRLCELTLWPRTAPLRVQHSALTDLYLLAGDLRLNGRVVVGPSFVVIEPSAELTLYSEYGCALLAWAEGPAWCADGTGRELYGFAGG
ncbi:MAG TPA: cupin domain-containing protein [Burkholderiaceae bacterium]|jgi:hypothetical protein|nr:cupin domain-containing protein [Burkholderiaceae bacterium]